MPLPLQIMTEPEQLNDSQQMRLAIHNQPSLMFKSCMSIDMLKAQPSSRLNEFAWMSLMTSRNQEQYTSSTYLATPWLRQLRRCRNEGPAQADVHRIWSGLACTIAPELSACLPNLRLLWLPCMIAVGDPAEPIFEHNDSFSQIFSISTIRHDHAW